MIEPGGIGNTVKVNTSTVTMDSSGTPQLVDGSGATVTLTAGATPCSFTSSTGSSMVVSPAGVVLVSNLKSDTNYYPTIAFPEQPSALSDIPDGTWNRIAWQTTGSGTPPLPYALSYGSVTLTSGVVSNVLECSVAPNPTAGGCTAQSIAAGSGFVVNPSGGFTGTGDLSGSVAFAYTTGGKVFVVTVDPDGSINILTPQVAQSLPTVGATNASWNLQANPAGYLAVPTNPLPGISVTDVTITSVSGTTVTRDASQDGATAVSQTLHYDAPLTGFRTRDGVVGSVSPAVFLPIPGMGLTVVSRLGAATPVFSPPSNGFFNYSVTQP